MTIISEIKKHIADNKLTDDQVRVKWLTADNSDAEEEQNDETDDASEVDGNSTTENDQVDNDADTDEDQPDIGELIKIAVAEQLAAMKKGKKPPKSKKKDKKAPTTPIWKEFGSIK